MVKESTSYFYPVKGVCEEDHKVPVGGFGGKESLTLSWIVNTFAVIASYGQWLHTPCLDISVTYKLHGNGFIGDSVPALSNTSSTRMLSATRH